MRGCPPIGTIAANLHGPRHVPNWAVLGGYITGENDGRACAGRCGDCQDIEQCDSTALMRRTGRTASRQQLLGRLGSRALDAH
jgi:hypothetical protein